MDSNEDGSIRRAATAIKMCSKEIDAASAAAVVVAAVADDANRSVGNEVRPIRSSDRHCSAHGAMKLQIRKEGAAGFGQN